MLKLIHHPNDILNQKLPEFDFNSPLINPLELEEQMIQLMLEHDGLGLSANQVGLPARVFVMKTSNLKDVVTPFAVFNPKVIAASPEEESEDEGCLSFPNLFFKVKRPSNIIVEFFDRNNNKCIIRLDGIDARCFLHELDHLDGVCFTSKISKLKLDLALKKQRKYNGRTKQRATVGI
jgi:peptide deformylase